MHSAVAWHDISASRRQHRRVRLSATSYLYPTTCGTKGHCSGSSATLRQIAATVYIFLPFPVSYPRPASPTAVLAELPFPLFPTSARNVDKRKTKERKQRKDNFLGCPGPTLISAFNVPLIRLQHYFLQLLPLLRLQGWCQSNHPPDLGLPQKGKNRWGRLFILEEQSDNWRPCFHSHAFPTALHSSLIWMA